MMPGTMPSRLATLLQCPADFTLSYLGPRGETGGGSYAHLLSAALLIVGSDIPGPTHLE